MKQDLLPRTRRLALSMQPDFLLSRLPLDNYVLEVLDIN